jgi:hypothetical protein
MSMYMLNKIRTGPEILACWPFYSKKDQDFLQNLPLKARTGDLAGNMGFYVVAMEA